MSAHQDVHEQIESILQSCGHDDDPTHRAIVAEMVQTCAKLLTESHDTGQLKLINAALKEMRYAFGVFNEYQGVRKISIYGSARTPEDHPDYEAARSFAREMGEAGWMVITGAGDGIMKAGHEGPEREANFGLRIRLPFETTANDVIEGDPKLINFRYFFTRKLMFMAHSDAIAVCPGGFGTQDELFEALTLIQTGKNTPVPVIMLEGEGGVYWDHWNTYIQKNLRDNGWICPDDLRLYHAATSPQDGAEHVLAFYDTYHSCRYVHHDLVIRLNRSLSEEDVAILNAEFSDIVAKGAIERGTAHRLEEEHLEKPRLIFHHARRAYGRLRILIDRINELGRS